MFLVSWGLLLQSRLRREVCCRKAACVMRFVVAKQVAFPFSLDLGFQHVKDRFCGDSARHILGCQERFDMDVAVRRFWPNSDGLRLFPVVSVSFRWFLSGLNDLRLLSTASVRIQLQR